MPRAPKQCSIPRCRNLATTKGRCVEHTPLPFERAKARWAAQRPSNWNFLRRKVIRLAGGRCARCGQSGSHVDHIKPVFEGGSWDLENLQLLCEGCHKNKTEEEKQRARAKLRRGRRRFPA